MRTQRNLFAAFVVLALCTACGTGANSRARNTEAAPASSAPVSPGASKSAQAETASTAMQDIDGLIATARGELAVYDSVDASTPSSTLPAKTSFGSPTTLLVTEWQGSDGTWLHVSLPVRPNGSTGYVRVADVTLSRAERRVDVDLAAKQLRVVDANGVVLETPVAIGSPENPTPTGAYFVTDVLDTQNDGGAYGPFAIGLSAHSETLTEFAGGDGEIGVHGTNDPGSIGDAVSHGCVRVPNDVVVQLAGMLPLGTPVNIN